MKRTLFLHQKRMVKWALSRTHFGLFAEMRLGKSLVLVRYAQEVLPHGACLIVAPLSVIKDTWEKELTLEGEEWYNACELPFGKRVEVIAKAWERREKRRVWVLINYESLREMGEKYVQYRGLKAITKRKTPVIALMPWSLVALDESTKIANVKAQISQVCAEGFRFAKHRVILSGLPSPEGEHQLYQQFKFLHGSFMGCPSFWKFQEKYMEPDPFTGGMGWRVIPGMKGQIHAAVRSKAYVLRRVDAGMPSTKVYETRSVKMTPKQRSIYTQIEKEYAAYIEKNDSDIETEWVLVQRLWLAKVAGGFDPEDNLLSPLKKDELLGLLKGDLSQEKAVIWFRFRHELEYVAASMRQEGISHVSIMGGMKQADRQSRLNLFRQGKAQCLLAMEQCGKFGLDCSIADSEIYYSNDWSCEARTQSEDRIVHPSKKHRPLLVLDLLTEGTIDSDVVKRLKDKKYNARELMQRIDSDLMRKYAK